MICQAQDARFVRLFVRKLLNLRFILQVCKTFIRRFDSDPRLQINPSESPLAGHSRELPKLANQTNPDGKLPSLTDCQAVCQTWRGNLPGSESHEALIWWSKVYLDATALVPMTEVALAEEVIRRVRTQEVWGKILRGEAN